MNDFFVVVILYAKAGQENQLRDDLTAVVDPSRKDEGNLRYELFEDKNDPRRFVFVEHWADPAYQHKHHTESEHILHFNANGSSRVEKVELFYQLNRIA